MSRAIAHVRALLATWRGRFIAAVVASQLVLPLDYYVVRRDRHDERFAWRMFSPMRMTVCEPRFVRDGQPIDLEHEFIDAWVKLARRGRFSVIEAMAARLCADAPGSSLAVTLTCALHDARAGEWQDRDPCSSRRLESSDAN